MGCFEHLDMYEMRHLDRLTLWSASILLKPPVNCNSHRSGTPHYYYDACLRPVSSII